MERAWLALTLATMPIDDAAVVDLGREQVLESHGEPLVVRVRIPGEGVAHVWARAPTFDPTLQVTTADGAVIATDDDSGGGTTAYVEFECAEEQEISVRVDSDGPAAAGTVTVRVGYSTRTASARASADELASLRARMIEFDARGEFDALRDAFLEYHDRIVREPTRTTSAVLLAELDALAATRLMARLAAESFSDADARASVHAISDLRLKSLDRVLPAEHERTQRAVDQVVVLSQYDPNRVMRTIEIEPRIMTDLERGRVQDVRRLARAHVTRAVARSSFSDWGAARREARAAMVGIAGMADAESAETWAQAALQFASASTMSGDLFEARSVLGALVEEFDRRGIQANSVGRFEAELQYAILLIHCGEIRLAADRLDGLYAVLAADDAPALTPVSRARLAFWYSRVEGALDQSEAALERLDRIRERPDGKAMLGILGELHRVELLLGAGRPAQALEQLEAVERGLASDPATRDVAPLTMLVSMYELRVADALRDFARVRDAARRFLELSSSVTSGNRVLDVARFMAIPTALMLGTCDADPEMDAVCAGMVAGARDEFVVDVTSATFAELEARTRFGGVAVAACWRMLRAQDGTEPRMPLTRAAILDYAELLAGARQTSATLLRATSDPRQLQERTALRQRWSALVRTLTPQIGSAESRGAISSIAAEVERCERLIRTSMVEDVGASALLRKLRHDAVTSTLSAGEVSITFHVSPEFDPCSTTAARNDEGEDPMVLGVIRVPGADPELAVIGRLREIERWLSEIANGPGSIRRGHPAQPDEAADSSSSTSTPMAELDRLLLTPLLPHVKSCARVIVVPTQALHLVPWEALFLENPKTASIDVELRTSLVDRWLDATNPVRSGEPTFVFVGGLDFDGSLEAPDEPFVRAAGTLAPADLREGSDRFDPLPGSAFEVEHIADSISDHADSVVRLTGKECSRQAFIAALTQADVVHVATHAVVRRGDSDGPTPGSGRPGSWLGLDLSAPEAVSPFIACGLAISGANRPRGTFGDYPGIVSAAEIAALDLSRCRLVVLSACATNAGVASAGGGIASFQDAFRVAGARAVLASLWPVRDAEAAEFMQDFHRRLWTDGLDVRSALRATKEWMRSAKDAKGKPRFAFRDWAGWALYGGDA